MKFTNMNVTITMMPTYTIYLIPSRLQQFRYLKVRYTFLVIHQHLLQITTSETDYQEVIMMYHCPNLIIKTTNILLVFLEILFHALQYQVLLDLHLNFLLLKSQLAQFLVIAMISEIFVNAKALKLHFLYYMKMEPNFKIPTIHI